MAAQYRQDLSSAPLILGGVAIKKSGQTLLTDGSRTTVLARNTVMAKVTASGKWVPWTDITAVNGAAYPRGIYVGPDVAAAALVAGDVTGCDILVGGAGCQVDKNLLVFENSLALTTAVGLAALAFAAGTYPELTFSAGTYPELTFSAGTSDASASLSAGTAPTASLSAGTAPTASLYNVFTCEDVLAMFGIFCQDSEDINNYENS